MPRQSSPSSAAARTGAEFSPTPPVKVMASTPAEQRGVRADVLADPMAVDVEGQRRRLGRRRRGANRPRACRCRRKPRRPLRRLSRSSISVDVRPPTRCRWKIDGRVEVAGAGAHDETFQRGQAHRGVDAAPARDRAGARAVTQVQDDRCWSLQGPAEQLRRCAGTRRRARCRGSRTGGCRTASATSVSIAYVKAARRQRRVERGVEDRHLWQVGQQPRGRPRCRSGRPDCAAARAASGRAIAATTSSVMSVGAANRSPPWTTRCPIAVEAGEVQRRAAIAG